MITTIRDAHSEYLDRLGADPDGEARTEEELRDYIHEHSLRYEELDDEFWTELFDSGWGYRR